MRTLIVAVLLTICSFYGSPVLAQQRSALHLGFRVDTSTKKATVSSDSTSSDRPAHVLKGALIGAAVGTGTGIVAAAIITSSSHGDHSLDSLAYFILGLTGAGLGIAVGAIVGFFWR